MDTDPRIARTREHVLASAQQILEQDGVRAVTFSAVAQAAQVSRNTLYRHWSTVEQLLVDVTLQYQAAVDAQPIRPQDIAEYLARLGASLQLPQTTRALTSLMSWAEDHPPSARVLQQIADARQAALETIAGPLSEVQIAQVVGPLFYQALLTHRHVDEVFLAGLTEGLRQLGLDRRVTTDASCTTADGPTAREAPGRDGTPP